MAPTAPMPNSTPLSAPFWEGTRAGELRLQCCDDCGSWRWTPQILCRVCHSPNFTWRATCGHGRLYSFTIVHRPPTPAFSAPYVVAVVELDEGPLMLTNLIDVALEAIAIDMPVKVAFRSQPGDAVTLYPFTAA